MADASAAKHVLGYEKAPHLEFALDMIEGRLKFWYGPPCNPIKGADLAVKALAEACVRDRKIARLKAELAKLEAE
jgi:hypothetical protein